jgi:hypothetical protein
VIADQPAGKQTRPRPVQGAGLFFARAALRLSSITRNLIRQFTKNGPVPSSTLDVAREYVTPSLTLRVMMRVNDGPRLARMKGSGPFSGSGVVRVIGDHPAGKQTRPRRVLFSIPGAGLFFARAALRPLSITRNSHPPIHEKRTCPQQYV